ncbi:hypothetical protein KY290_033352 [Solanum tuberosum]|uniref:Uncharacterized protein n=1 Tax=Solanum tuberosum TaxID=4113 RepID=A0ABQ7U161_SOLTU|nr:hypothetical protein KY289_032716 [Solanum tuberosum]KAH0647352.1 hypothetical protein KY285_032600 [Solanum tuberosum]KAH0740309.1 hypothetical protein KY290_033352 [Solanum tuberosum]
MKIGSLTTVTGEQELIRDWTRKQTLDSMSSLQSLLISASQGSLAAQYDSLHFASSSLIFSWQMSKITSFNCKIIPVCAKLYIVATSNFSLVNLFGEGTRVFVYRADIPHGKEEQFMEVMQIASTLKHPIISLVSYSAGHGNHFLVYEYIRNVTLDDALNHVVCMPLTWSLRIHIARALNSKPEGEQSVVEWASSKLHDSESLLEMADPTIRRTSSIGVPSSSEGTISQGRKRQRRRRGRG